MDWPQPPCRARPTVAATVTAPTAVCRGVSCGGPERFSHRSDAERPGPIRRGSLALVPLPAIATWSLVMNLGVSETPAEAPDAAFLKCWESPFTNLVIFQRRNRPSLSVLGSALEWTSEQRARHGRLASFLRRQPELWLSGGFVGEAKMRDWQRPKSPLQLRALEFFSGIGGRRWCVASPLANEVYSSNFHVAYEPLLPKDIRRVEQAETIVKARGGTIANALLLNLSRMMQNILASIGIDICCEGIMGDPSENCCATLGSEP
eukprot:s989_g6.t1